MTKEARDKNNQSKKMKTVYVFIAIIYLCVFSFVVYQYINENRYWEFYSNTVITTEKGQNIMINAVIKNKMYYVMSSTENYFLSYHISKESGELHSYENPRTAIEKIKPGTASEVTIQIQAPLEEGKYVLEIDIVKEGEYWFSDRGERTGIIYLTVI